MSSRSVVVAGLGARTALGLIAQTSAAAVRAELSMLSEHPFTFDSVGAASGPLFVNS